MSKNDSAPETLEINEVECWREAREWVAMIYALTAQEVFQADALLRDLLRMRSMGVMAKISDGYHRRSKKLFLERLEEARGLLGESISYLHVAFDLKTLTHDQLNDALGKAYTVGIRINSFIKHQSA